MRIQDLGANMDVGRKHGTHLRQPRDLNSLGVQR